MNDPVFTVYVLYSEKWNRNYTGYTSDLLNRFRSHNQYGKDWTARFRPWIAIYTEVYLTKREAAAREKWLKTGAGRDFIKKIISSLQP